MRHIYAYAHGDVLVMAKKPCIGNIIVIQGEDDLQHTGVVNQVSNLKVTIVENRKDSLYKNTYYYVLEKY